MIGRTNSSSGGGGGIGNTVAFITVTYPEGSTCTCSNGQKTFRDKTTTGSWIVSIPELGEWTVHCSDTIDGEEKTAEETVSISTVGEAKAVNLSYGVMLYNNGLTFDSVTEGWQRKARYSSIIQGYEYGEFKTDRMYYNSGYAANGNTVNFFTQKKIDLSEINKIYYELYSSEYLYVYGLLTSGFNPNSEYLTIYGNGPSTPVDTRYVVTYRQIDKALEKVTLLLDVSEFNDSYYVGWCATGTSLSTNVWYAECYKVWGEK